MADYRFAAQAISRSAGRSAIAAAAYRAGTILADERTGLEHDYTRKGGVLHTEIMAPVDAPDWTGDRAMLWNQVEKFEKRKDAQVAREVQLSLPHELNHQQHVTLVRDFVRENFVAQGMVADIAIHAPPRDGDQRNHHAHVMLTTRDITAEGFAGKRRDWNSKEVLGDWRAQWAVKQNQHLRQAIGERAPQVTHKSYAERGLQKTPGHHLGPAATALERRSAASRRGDLNRAARTWNEQAGELRSRQAKLVDQLPKVENSLNAVAFEVVRIKEILTDERAERSKELIAMLKDMRGKRVATLGQIDRATLEPFIQKEREAREELQAARERAQLLATPKEIMRWFTNPAASLWNAAKKSMATDIAGQKTTPPWTNKAGFKHWLRTDIGKEFVRTQIAILTKNAPDVEAAAQKLRTAERTTANVKRFLKSEKGVRNKLAKLQELQGDLPELRTKERRARRNIAQIDRYIRFADRVEKVANGLAETQSIGAIKMPARNINTQSFLLNVSGSLNDFVQKMTPQQTQALSLFLKLGRSQSISRG